MKENVVPDFTAARQSMVDGQLRPCGIVDSRILAAMGKVPREIFVPFTHVGIAYIDDNIRLISNRYLIKPLILAKLLQAAEIQATDRVLELAPATGYSTLILSELAESVYTVEPDAVLYKEVEKNVLTNAPGKTIVLAGAPVEGCLARSPFDVILINGSVEFVPPFLFEHLSDNGRLVAVVAPGPNQPGQARLYRKKDGEVSITPLFETTIPPAPGFSNPSKFEF